MTPPLPRCCALYSSLKIVVFFIKKAYKDFSTVAITFCQNFLTPAAVGQVGNYFNYRNSDARRASLVSQSNEGCDTLSRSRCLTLIWSVEDNNLRRILFLTKWRWREAALSELKCWKWRVFVDPVQTVCPGAPSSPCLIGQRAAQSSAQEETGLDLLLLGMLPFLFCILSK